MSSWLPEDALRELVEAGYFETNEAGWHRAVRPPRKADLAWYVHTIKTLGAWSTGGGRVEVSCGDLPYEILFRIRVPGRR